MGFILWTGLWKLEFSYRARRASLLNICSNGQCAFLLQPGLYQTLMQSQGADGSFGQAMMVSEGTITGMVVNSGIVENVVYSPVHHWFGTMMKRMLNPLSKRKWKTI
jgi:hypothetical protein